MATIGRFTRTADGYSGRITTLTLDVEVGLRPSPKDNEKAPDFRIFGPGGVFGAAWQRVSAADREYLSCKLDDPTFPAPIYGSLLLSDDGETYVLIWTR
jgi:uncharacterized protein (DUF736 family)